MADNGGERTPNLFEDILFDDWEDAMLDQLFAAEELALSSIPKPPSTTSKNPSSSISHHHHQPPPSLAVSTLDTTAFSPPRELSQRLTHFDAPRYSPPRPQKPDSDKELEIELLKKELGRASKQIANLEQECLNLKREKDKKEEQLKIVSSKNEEANACAKCSGSRDKDFGTLAPDHHNTSSKVQNGVSSIDPIVETTVKVNRVNTEMVSHREAQDFRNNDVPSYLDLSQQLLAVWGSSTDKKLGSGAISKLLMRLPSEITQKLLTDINSSGVSLYDVKDCTPEAEKVSRLYLALTKIADGKDILETLIEPLLDLCDVENVVVVRTSLCIMHTLLKLLLELETNFGRRDNVFIEGICDEKDLMDSGGLEGLKDGKFFNEEIHRKECWSHHNALQSEINWPYLFETMHQIAMKITEESVRVEVASIMKLLLLRSNAYFERDQFSQKIVFKTISEFLKEDAGLRVRNHALRLLYLVLNCPKLLARFCCGCKEGDDSVATEESSTSSDFQNYKIILQRLAECVVSAGGGLRELKISRNAILVLAFLASSGKPGFEILVGHKLAEEENYLMLILQLLVSEMNFEAEAHDELPEIFRERSFLIREILILLNRLVSSPSYSATVLRGLTNGRDMTGWTVDAATRLSRKGNENKQQDSMVKHIRTEIVDLARLFKKRVFTYLGDEWL
ncbi:protein SENSITIVE TO UV 2 [Lotus japonicus]|uniref:protein SENSITIVE TO UV 2 n=1 Tax=Lotus japonicus TaxID=34305 RepID=UPI0025885AF9|nr:protein SENSITIVE TO UV 2 [Lotus japonicus]